MEPKPTPTTNPSAPENTPSTQPPAASTTDEPADDESETETSESKKPETTTTAPTTTEQQRSARAVAPGEINPAIVVEITEFIVDGKPGEQMKVGNDVSIKGTWDASAADPKGGQRFTVQFPDVLKLGGKTEFELMGGDVVWGNCTVDVTTNLMDCVLTNEVDGLEKVKGTFEVFAKAEKITEDKYVDFILNGKATPVPLPGDGPITDGYELPKESTKSGEIDKNNWQTVRWTIDILGSDLAAMGDANTGSVTLIDTLKDNMKLCEKTADGKDLVNAQLKSGRKDLSGPHDAVTITQEGGAGKPVLINIQNGKDGNVQPFDPNMRYQVQYTTCATDGVSEADITYSNSVVINGKDVGSEGVPGKFVPQTGHSKSGRWVNEKGETDNGGRRSMIEWAITVPGTMFFDSKPDQTVTILDTLTAINAPDTAVVEHKYCDGNLEIYRAERLATPGVAKPKPKNVTDKFTIVGTPEAGKDAFTTSITPNPKFDLDATKYYYEVRFQTCLTGSDIPLSTDKFINTAEINDIKKPASVSGHGFAGDKSGSIQNVPQTVAGVEQPAGTTLNWNVVIPGQHLENTQERAVITDAFSDTMTVCEVSGDLKADLNLKVTAKQQYAFANGKTRGDRDLTGETDVAVVKNAAGVVTGLTITLPKADATDDYKADYNRETRYYIDYTLCTSSGGMDDRNTPYSNTVTYTGQTKPLTGSSSQTWGGSGTGQGVSSGSFSLLKKADQFSEEFPEDTVFTVKVEEFSSQANLDANKPAIAPYEIKVKADGTPVSGLNNRGNGWIIRLTEVNLPTVPGVAFEPGKFLPAEGVTLNADRTVALVAITPKSNVAVELVNKAVLGTAKVTKTVIAEEGTGLTGDEAFVIMADIAYGDENSGTEKREFTLKDGQFYDLGKLPIGAKVTFNEVKPMDTDRVTWSEPKIEPKTLTIGADATANVVKVTNEAKVTQGTFALSKKLTGPESNNAAVPDSFEVNATWTEAGVEKTKTLTLPSDGTSVPFGQNLPGGTQVTLTEVVPADGNGLAWGTPAFSGSVTISEDGNAVVTIGKEPGKVKVTNTVTKNDGTMRITKSVNGEAAEAVGDDVKFTVEARWKEGANYRTQILTVKNGEITPLGFDLPYGTEVTFTETDRPEVEGVEWGKITWGTNPGGELWLISNADGTATGIVSDDPDEGRLITLTNEAKWKFGSVEFTKHILGEDGKTTPAKDASLPAGAEFEVKIDGIDPALPEGTDFPAVGSTITLNAGNGFTWTSKEVLPRNTVVTFSEVAPKALPGIDWARPYYEVTKDANPDEGEDRSQNVVWIIPGDKATVEIHNRIIPTTDVDIEKIVTGPKGDKVMKDPSSTFQITATWTDVDDEARSCVLDVKPGGSVTPTAQCDAPVIDGKVQFPLNTKINFVETGAHTDVTNVQWGEVVWGVKDGKADLGKLESEPTGTTVEFTGEQGESVVLGLENKTSSKGLIIIPLPIPLPPFGGDWGSLIPGPGPGPGPDAPVVNPGPSDPGTGHNGAPGKPAPSKPNQSPSLPVTGANVIWLAGAAIVLIAGGTMLTLRNRRKLASEE